MNMDELLHANFATLDTNITDWSTVVTNLKNLEKQAREDLKAKADKANWAGDNASVTREFVDKTVGEFADAVTEATSIRDILKDTRDELVGYRDDLKSKLELARRKNITVTSTADGGFTVTMLVHPDRAAKGTEVPSHSQQDVDFLRDDVQLILNRATESDTTAAQVLRALVDQAEQGFANAVYGDRDSAVEALEKAEDIAQIIKKKGDDMTPEEFDKVNSTLAAYANDPLFQERFAATLGPRGVLDFWADLSDPSDGGALQRTRFNQYGELQKNLSLTLAGATQIDSPKMQEWKEDMLKLSGERIQTRGTTVYGFQIMSNLMRVGDYDDKFLNKYGDSLIAQEKKMKLPGNFWTGATGGPMMPRMNFMGDGNGDFGRDPMTGFMMALTNSPDAAADFFSSTDPQDNAEWVLKDRRSFNDGPQNGPNPALEATGNAMFAATSGMNPNDENAQFVPHSGENKEALDQSLKHLAEAGDDFPSELRESAAKMLGNWGAEVHESASAIQTDRTPLDYENLLEVSKQVSRDQGSHEILMRSINTAIVADIHGEHTGDPEEELKRAGQTVGFLESARYQALETDKEDPSWNAKWGYHIVGGAFNFVPTFGDAIQRGVDAAAYAWQLEEQGRIDDKNAIDNSNNFTSRQNYLASLADEWAKANPDHRLAEDGNKYLRQDSIGNSAFNGNSTANRKAGIAPQ
ncbi:DUF6571 family protein [Streptomyces paludis]|nr:DUF6571 family protein [Streptomyces paludis]